MQRTGLPGQGKVRFHPALRSVPLQHEQDFDAERSLLRRASQGGGLRHGILRLGTDQREAPLQVLSLLARVLKSSKTKSISRGKRSSHIYYDVEDDAWTLQSFKNPNRVSKLYVNSTSITRLFPIGRQIWTAMVVPLLLAFVTAGFEYHFIP